MEYFCPCVLDAESLNNNNSVGFADSRNLCCPFCPVHNDQFSNRESQ